MTKFFISIVCILLIGTIVHFGANSPIQCGPNEVYQQCGSACPEYCNWNPMAPCTLQCVQGCFCRRGYVRYAVDSNYCIPRRQCSRVPSCKENEDFRVCGSACPKYCGQTAEPCLTSCVIGCQCKPGYVLANKNSTECILESECPI